MSFDKELLSQHNFNDIFQTIMKVQTFMEAYFFEFALLFLGLALHTCHYSANINQLMIKANSQCLFPSKVYACMEPCSLGVFACKMMCITVQKPLSYFLNRAFFQGDMIRSITEKLSLKSTQYCQQISQQSDLYIFSRRSFNSIFALKLLSYPSKLINSYVSLSFNIVFINIIFFIDFGADSMIIFAESNNIFLLILFMCLWISQSYHFSKILKLKPRNQLQFFITKFIICSVCILYLLTVFKTEFDEILITLVKGLLIVIISHHISKVHQIAQDYNKLFKSMIPQNYLLRQNFVRQQFINNQIL